jgi:hypothetical protein
MASIRSMASRARAALLEHRHLVDEMAERVPQVASVIIFM